MLAMLLTHYENAQNQILLEISERVLAPGSPVPTSLV